MKRMEELQQEMLAMSQSGNIDQVRYMEIATEMQSLAPVIQRQQMEQLMVEQQEQHRRMMREMGHEPDAEDEAEFQAMLEKQKEDFMRPAGASYAASQAMMQDTQLMDHMMQNAEEMNAQLMSLFSDDDDDGMTEEEAIAFIAENTPPPQQARLLPIGALLIGTHDEPYQTLALTQDAEYTESVLEGGWGIESREEGIEMLESLLAGRHATLFHDEFMAIKNGNADEADDENVEDYEATVEALVEILELPQQLVDGCQTLLAWDLERVGYLCRLFANIGYITQDEAWEWMEKAAKLIKVTFSSWEEYIVSLLIGRGFAMGIHREPFAVAYDLLTDSREFLDAYPISAL